MFAIKITPEMPKSLNQSSWLSHMLPSSVMDALTSVNTPPPPLPTLGMGYTSASTSNNLHIKCLCSKVLTFFALTRHSLCSWMKNTLIPGSILLMYLSRDMVESLSFNPLTLYGIILIIIEDEVNERHVLWLLGFPFSFVLCMQFFPKCVGW